uniref:Uncharacterized protein n=1 Tax=Lotus japonicus TaxID=34305 RepID=I3S7B6_LOTJA|nr:unknown [Lotus japonicus]
MNLLLQRSSRCHFQTNPSFIHLARCIVYKKLSFGVKGFIRNVDVVP